MPVVLPKRPQSILARTPIASAVLLALTSPSVMAQQESTSLGEVIVTAQKRSENLQDVPISLESISNESIEELNIQNFKTYTQYLPSVQTQQSMQSGGGYNLVYMRGVATGGDGQAITSMPSVGTYLDEQPITTIRGNLDVHLYDIARVEALAGPQGTLYGASSQAGTIRIITNMPDASGFASGYSVEGNYVDGDEFGYVAEGFVNIPMGETAAIRIVGWAKHEPGWIDNVEATRVYPGNLADPDDDVTVNNAEFAEDNYNTVDTVGARAALRIDLGDNWTVTPSLMYQKSEQEGSWGDDINDFIPEAAGKNKVAHFRDEFFNDEWYQAGLTIEGSISNFDVVYSGNYLNREDDGSSDYSDYSYFYDLTWSTGPYAGTFANLFVDNNGVHLNRAHSYTADDYYTKTSHEVRISTPVDKRVRGLLGFFYQKQYHDFHEEFGNVEGLADFRSMNFLEPDSQRFPGVVYLNSMDRTDYEEAVFGQVQFDITDTLELSLGGRFFDVENKVHGFFGFGLGFNPGEAPSRDNPNDIQPFEPGDPAVGGTDTFLPGGAAWSRNGEWRCPSQEDRKDAPCVNADRNVTESDSVYRVNLGWKATDTSLLYATWSEGFRPGGINRNPAVPDYVPDYPHQLRARLEVALGGRPSAIQRRRVPRGVGQHPGRLPGPERHHAGREWSGSGNQGNGNAAGLARHRQPAAVTRGGVLRFGADERLCSARRAEGAGRNSVADHRGVQGQRDRALHVPAGRIRGARTGIARVRRQPLLRPRHRRRRRVRGGNPVEHIRRPLVRHRKRQICHRVVPGECHG